LRGELGRWRFGGVDARHIGRDWSVMESSWSIPLRRSERARRRH